MANLVLSMFVSLDGYIERPGGEFVPPRWSDDLERHWSGYALERAGHLIYGRTNFLFNKGFWSAAETDPASPAAGIAYAGTMNRLPKTVFSRTLKGDPGWNATLVADDVAGAIGRLKAESAGDLYLFGGAGIAVAATTSRSKLHRRHLCHLRRSFFGAICGDLLWRLLV